MAISHHTSQPKTLCRKLALAVAFLFASTTHAAYTLIDDDLLPTAAITAREAPPPIIEQHAIPFAKNRVILGPLGRRTIDNLIASLSNPNVTINIIGRSDAMANGLVAGTDNTTLTIATARTDTLRQYLLRKGIPAASITTSPDNAPNPQANGSIYPSYFVVTRHRAQPDYTAVAPTYPAITSNLSYTAAPTTIAAHPPTHQFSPTPTAAIAADPDRLVRFINQSVQAGNMDANVALELITNLFNTTMTPSAAPPVAAPLFVATPALVRRDPWVLSATLTLRDNIDAWSKQAGWNPVQWEASNYYEVKRTTTIPGDFPEVLREVADATGLNICAKKSEKYVRVTDAGTRCDK